MTDRKLNFDSEGHRDYNADMLDREITGAALGIPSRHVSRPLDSETATRMLVQRVRKELNELEKEQEKKP
jgi:hypothetical protein